jgi:hypothetical protein
MPDVERRTTPVDSPVVDYTGRAILGVELEDRQQFQRRNAELLKIGNLLG